jgi:hypothetical protein
MSLTTKPLEGKSITYWKNSQSVNFGFQQSKSEEMLIILNIKFNLIISLLKGL